MPPIADAAQPLTSGTSASLRGPRQRGRIGAGQHGHDYANVLTDAERRAVIEYLKAL